MTDRQPTVFLGHGNPLYAIGSNRWTTAWRELAATMPTPTAIVSFSAHWYVRGLGVTAMSTPRTIHDFGGFPRALFEVEYPAPGHPELAERIGRLLAPRPVVLDDGWGLDHGTWSVLVHLYPQADIPVVQVSIDATQPAAHHAEVGRRLAELRDEGVLLLGSGNIVHHLGRADPSRDEPYDWAARFDAHVQGAVEAGDDAVLLAYDRHPDGLLAAPTPDHYLPLLYVLGARDDRDPVSVVTDGFDVGSISMRSLRFG